MSNLKRTLLINYGDKYFDSEREHLKTELRKQIVSQPRIDLKNSVVNAQNN